MEDDNDESGLLYPKIENVFSNATIIKSEPLDYDENEYEESIELSEYDTSEYFPPIPNKIILGSKPTETVEALAETSTASENWETFQSDEFDVSQNDLDADTTTNSFLVPRSNSVKSSKSTMSSNSYTDDEPEEPKRQRTLKSTGKVTDWQQTYPCEQCDTVLPTQTDLDAHKMSHFLHVPLRQKHKQNSKSFIEDSTPQVRKRQKAVKSTGKSSLLNKTFPVAKSASNPQANTSDPSDQLLCNHCDKTFTDEIALMKHTYELLPEKTFVCDICEQGFNTQIGLRGHRAVHFRKYKTKKNVSVVECKPSLQMVPKSGDRFKCKLCKQIFTTRYAATKHKSLKHPSYKQKNTYETIKPTQRETATSKPIKPRQGTSLSKNLLLTGAPIPKQTLFKCNKCQIHFVTCSTALEHSKRCVLAKGDWKCSKCRRTFTHMERPIHTLQHEHSDKFKVHIVNDKILGKVVCCCPKCELLFDENTFWKHVSAGCKIVSGVDCNTCNFNMHPDAVSKHQKYHGKYGLSRTDFILIEFVDAGIKAEPSSVVEDGKQRLYFCKICKTNSYSLKNKTVHQSALCTSKTDTKNCLTCGLLFSFKVYAKHMLDHTEKNYTLNDYYFVTVQDNKVINPPLPEFRKCETCKVRFLSLLAKKVHDCKVQEYTKCVKCFHKYDSKAYDIHKGFHEYCSTGDVSKVESNKIYVYCCVSCDYGFNTYDGLVEHCQNHYNDTQLLKTKPCNFCKLEFSEDHDVNHRYVKILKFNHEVLLQEEFMEGFYPISREQVDYILSKSMYGMIGNMRNVRLQLEVDGPPERSLYRCAQCGLCFDMNNVFEHTQEPCSKSPRYSCNSCTSEFPTKSTAAKHNNIHVIFGDDITFREVVFNNQLDKELNEALRTGRKKESLKFRKCLHCELLIKKNEYQSHIAAHKQWKTLKGKSRSKNKGYTIFPSPGVKKMYTVYRCVVCKADLMQKRNVLRHNCLSTAKSVKCKKCSLTVKLFFQSKHEKVHINRPKFVTKNITVLNFKLQYNLDDLPQVTPKENRKTSGKTFDKSYVDNETDIDNNIDDNASAIDVNDNASVVEENNATVLNETLTDDQAAYNLMTWKIESRNRLFQCDRCYMCFSNKNLLLEHLPNCNSSSEPYTCDLCDITYHPLLVAFDNKLHDLVSSKPNENYIYLTSVTLGGSETWLYKCKSCEVHYLSFNALVHHFNQNHISAMSYVECDICKLKFSIHTRTKHMQYHATSDYSSSDSFNIESIERKFLNSASNVISVKDQITSKRNSNIDDTEDESQTTDVSMSKSDERSTNLSVYNEHKASNSIAEKSSNEPSFPLYKCISCNVHYINRQTLLCHMREKNRVHETAASQCDICNIEFGLLTLKKHKALHHPKGKQSNFIIHTITDNIFYDDLNELDEVTDDNTQSESENGAEHDNEYNIDEEKTNASSVDPDDLAPSTLKNDANEMITIRLYQCKDCRICVEKSQREFHVCCSDIQKKRCIQCSLAFARNDISQHMRLHRKYPELSRKNYVLVRFGQRSAKSKIYKCVACSTHFVSIQTLQWHIDVRNHQTKREYCGICGLFFAKFSLSRHVYIHHTKLKLPAAKFDIVYVSTDTKAVSVENKSTETSNLVPDLDAVLPKSHKKLFRCFECDVYFLTQTAYYKHMYNHVELDPTEFIACKMCDMQFLTEDLGVHMKSHRDKTFNMENLIIEGYQPCNGSPRVESYSAVDGLDSKLVSTTTPFDNDEDDTKIEQLSAVDSTSAKLQ